MLEKQKRDTNAPAVDRGGHRVLENWMGTSPAKSPLIYCRPSCRVRMATVLHARKNNDIKMYTFNNDKKFFFFK